MEGGMELEKTKKALDAMKLRRASLAGEIKTESREVNKVAKELGLGEIVSLKDARKVYRRAKDELEKRKRKFKAIIEKLEREYGIEI